MSIDPMEEIRASFFVECEDLLESLNDAMRVIEGGGGDPEAINVMFRAVHSIKGGAGAFGLDALVAVAHRIETVLDAVRAGLVALDPTAVALFYQGADLLHDHVRAARDDRPAPDGAEVILTAIEALLGGTAAPATVDAAAFAPMPLTFAIGDAADAPSGAGPDSAVAGVGVTDFSAYDDAWPGAIRAWCVRLTPRAGLYQSGNEVQHLLRGIAALGRATISCIVPADLALDPDAAEVPRLSWDLRLEGEIDRAEIEELFEFVADVCDFTIKEGAPPGATGGAFDDATPLPPATAAMPSPVAAARSEAEADSHRPAADTAQAFTPEPAPQPERPAAEAEAVPVTVRVGLDKIDRLLNLVSELVINQAMLSQSVSSAGLASPEVVSGLEGFMSLTRDIQDGVMSVRAQPVKPLFQRMARIVRETSALVGKSVRLHTEGEGTEVDKTLIERLAEPLTHIIRNALDHGLEAPDARIAAGKPPEGTITLSALHRAGRILIEVSDDGAGIDRPKVQAIAAQKGLIPHDAVLSDAEIDGLLFLPGFSTAQTVSALSGRGVGMDVVKSAITGLSGRISITSKRGRGTTLSISLPLTLAVLDGMVVSAAGQTFVIPLSAIVETARLVPDAIKRVGVQGELLHMRGDLIPLIDLAARLGFRGSADKGRGGIVLLTAQDDGGRAALIVDSIMEQRQVVIKGLGAVLGPIPGVAAATILGDGQIALILDPADLTRKGIGPVHPAPPHPAPLHPGPLHAGPGPATALAGRQATRAAANAGGPAGLLPAGPSPLSPPDIALAG